MTDVDQFATSDKISWHRYMDFYEPYLKRFSGAAHVLEYGVFHGASIGYLHDRYSDARIVGCDILPIQPEWPVSERIRYVRLDQGSPTDLDQLFADNPEPFDLVIEDGSHEPEHQRNCLAATLPHVRDGGIYILEDLHTSHPGHPMVGRRHRFRTNCYHLLLAFEHLHATATPLTDEVVARLTRNSLFTPDEVRAIFERIEAVDLYRRATLPLRCFKCGSVDFEYSRLRCVCGVEIAATADSISAALKVSA